MVASVVFLIEGAEYAIGATPGARLIALLDTALRRAKQPDLSAVRWELRDAGGLIVEPMTPAAEYVSVKLYAINTEKLKKR